MSIFQFCFCRLPGNTLYIHTYACKLNFTSPIISWCYKCIDASTPGVGDCCHAAIFVSVDKIESGACHHLLWEFQLLPVNDDRIPVMQNLGIHLHPDTGDGSFAAGVIGRQHLFNTHQVSGLLHYWSCRTRLEVFLLKIIKQLNGDGVQRYHMLYLWIVLHSKLCFVLQVYLLLTFHCHVQRFFKVFQNVIDSFRKRRCLIIAYWSLLGLFL